MNTVSTIFTGDIILNNQKINYKFPDKILKDFSDADYVIANLEGPILDKVRPKDRIPKAGPHVHQDRKRVNKYLEQLNIKYLGASNNHIFDYGPNGQALTEKCLRKSKIFFNGFGQNMSTAAKYVLLEKSKIVYLSVCEEEFGISGQNSPGAYSMYCDDVLNKIHALSQRYSVVIMAHGGCEKVPFTSKYILDRYRQFIDSGAKLVVGHHPHVLQPYEKYKSGYIFYSLGNFLNDLTPFYKCMILKVVWNNGEIKSINPMYIKIKKGEILTDNNMKSVISKLRQILKNPQELHKHYQYQSIYLYLDHYKKYFTGHFLTDDKSRNLKSSLLLYHLIRNNSHKEFIESALKLITGEVKKDYNLLTLIKYNLLLKAVNS